MKIYIKTNDEWFITESSLQKYAKKEEAEVVEASEEQYENIRNQYDTRVENGKIVEQTEWNNAKLLKEMRISAEKREAAEKKARETEESSKSAE